MAGFNLGLDDPNMLAGQQQPFGQLQTPQLPKPLDPKLIQYLLESYGVTQEQDANKDKLAQAQALRGTALPEGRNAGRVYTAANPLEFLGAGLKQYAGYRDEKKLEPVMADQRAKQADRMKQLAEAIIKAQGGE